MKKLTRLIMLIVLIVFVAGCREFHFDDFQPGADGVNGIDGGTSYPFITEIPATPAHLNGGWMHTWYILDASLQLTDSSHFIGAYPIYNGNDGADGQDGTDGKDGINGTNGLTPYIGDDGYWWIGNYRTSVYSVGADGTDGQNGQDGADGVSPIIIENYWYVWDSTTNTYINTYITSGTDGQNGQDGQDGTNGSDGQDGSDGTNGNDGTGVASISEEPSPNCGERGGTKVTIHLTDGSSYYFSVCNGEDGTLPEPPDDCIDISAFCTGIYSTNNRKVIDEGFNSETVPYASGWTSSGDFYDFIDDHLVTKDGELTTPDLQLANVTEIRMEAFEYKKYDEKWITAWVLDVDGNWTALDEYEVTIYYKKDRDAQVLIWETSIENITNIRFTFRSNTNDHNNSKVVINNISITGDDVTCVQTNC